MSRLRERHYLVVLTVSKEEPRWYLIEFSAELMQKFWEWYRRVKGERSYAT